MRVLHVYKAYPPVMGGIERHLQLLAEGEARRGLDVTVLVASAGGPTTTRTENGVRVLRARSWGTVASTPLSPALVAQIGRLRPDITHLHFPYPPAELAHLALGRAASTLVTYHSDIVRQRVLGRLYAPVMRRVLGAADRILVTSEPYLRSSPHLRSVAARCDVVPLGIDPRPYEVVNGHRAGDLPGHGDSPVILFVGALRHYKGLDVLIDAVARVDATLLVVGAGPMEGRWRRLASDSPASARIRFLGHVPDEDLPACYAAADVVVLPSVNRGEAFGLVLLEAMASGRPVVSTELGTATSWVNEDGRTGRVVAPGDAGALAGALQELLRDPERRRQLGESGRQRVRNEFHVERMVDRTVAIYEDVLAGRRRRGEAPGPEAPLLAPAAPPVPVTHPAAGDAELSPQQRALLLTVAYSDLFDYPLTRSELHRYLVAPCASRDEFDRALDGLLGGRLSTLEGFVLLPGRERIVPLRVARQQDGERRWALAARYARWLARVPFVRMVAVCGSLAAGNARPDADIDIFLVTDPGRLWVVQVWSMVLRRVASLFAVRVCPNYLLAADALEVETKNLFTAREVAQATPLWGVAAYERFREANGWVTAFLPNLHVNDDRRARLVETPRSRLASWCERALGGRAGSALDAVLHRVLLWYYPLRLRHLGWRAAQFRQAYRRDRQVVMRGGYGPAVERAFRERAIACLGERAGAAEVARLFPHAACGATEPDPDRLFARLFTAHYGKGHD